MSISTFALAAAAFAAGMAAFRSTQQNPHEQGTTAYREWAAGLKLAAFQAAEAVFD